MKTQKNVTFVGIFTVFVVLGLLFAACGDPEGGPTGGNTVLVTGVTLNKTVLSLTVGQEEALTPTVRPSDATNKAVRWSSSDTGKATVDVNGKVSAKAAGTAKITVTTADGGFTAECNVSVQSAGPGNVPVTGVTLDNPAISLAVGDSQTLTATVVPENASVKTVSWTSNATAIATVDANGKVEAKAVGTAKITVTTTEGAKTAECTVTVTRVPVSIAVTTPPTKTLYATGETLDLTGLVVTATYDDNSTGTVTITTEHITGFNPNTAGEQILTITYGGKPAIFTVTVLALTKIEVTKSPDIVAKGEELDIEEIEIEATWGDDTTDKYIKKKVEITLANISGFDKDKAESQTVTVTYEGKSDTFIVTVLAITKIEITSPVTKTRYAISDSLSIVGLEVEATWGDDGTDKYIKGKVTITAADISGFDSATAGTKTLIVTYSSQTATFTITVFATVTFNPNGGNWDGSTANKTEEVEGTTVTKPDNPEKEGYTFGEWYKEAALTNQWNFAIETVSINTTLYAKWNPITYTVRYDKNSATASGTMTDSSHTYDVEKALTVNTYTLTDHAFGGWNTKADYSGTNYSDKQNVKNLTTTSEGIVTLYAVWLTLNDADFGQGAVINNIFNVSNLTEWNNAIYIISNSGDDNNYIINIVDGFSVPGSHTSTFGNARGLKVSIRSEGKTLSLSSTSNGNILSTNGNTIILRGLNLQGRSNNTNCLVWINGGTFIMNYGKIFGNTATGSGDSGGVYISGGIFIMFGGEITGNEAVTGGGVCLDGNGTFVMYGGKISMNTAQYGGGVYDNGQNFTTYGGEITSNNAAYRGGGVFTNGIFTMYGGKISGNTTTALSSGNGSGGGVFGLYGSFTMNGGEISDNTASTSGGGVYVTYSLTMNDGKIFDNTASNNGGGVYGNLTMNGGEISGNTASDSSGGGVFGNLTMNGGEIFGNIASNNGGGVYVNGSLRITTGTIYGTSEGTNSNTATEGAALYREGSSTAQYGTFSGSTWNSNGLLFTRNDTLRVVNGVLQQ